VAVAGWLTDMNTIRNKLEGRAALVTGAGRGVGKGIALELARAGCRVAVNYQSSPDLAEATVAEIRAIGGEAFSIKADVGTAFDVREMIAGTVSRFGGLDVLVNNAGIQTWKPFLEVTETDWDQVINTNLKGCFLCSQTAALYMKDHGGGAIVNIGSGCNKLPFPNLVAYTASKGESRCSRRLRQWSLAVTAFGLIASPQARSKSNARG